MTGASLGFVTAMLVLYGLGLTAGNWLGGRFADRSVDRTLLVTLASLTAILIAFAATMPFAVPTAVLVAAGREGRGTVATGQPVTVQGRYDEGQLRASYIVDAAGKVTAVGPRGPGHDGQVPRRGPRHDGPPPPAAARLRPRRSDCSAAAGRRWRSERGPAAAAAACCRGRTPAARPATGTLTGRFGRRVIPLPEPQIMRQADLKVAERVGFEPTIRF